MNEEQLDQLIKEAGPRVRPAPPLDADAMWARVEAQRLQPPVAAGGRWNTGWLLKMAATLFLGVAIGRLSVGFRSGESTSGASVVAVSATPRSLSQPLERTATALLGETAALLSALPATDRGGAEDRRFGRLAQELLVTTRLLLDDGVASDPRLHELLDDLELILSQVARLQHRSSQTELELINEAMQERELVPRIRRAAASLAADD